MENKLRFKTEQEFLEEFGEGWRSCLQFSHWSYEMDYLFGLECKPEWVNSVQLMHGENRDLHYWGVDPDMVTDKPLPEAKAETPEPEQTPSHGFKVGDKVELNGVIGAIIALRYDSRYGHGIKVDWNNGLDPVYYFEKYPEFPIIKLHVPEEPTIFDRFPIGTKVRIEGSVLIHATDDDAHPIAIQLENGEEFWLYREHIKYAQIIKD